MHIRFTKNRITRFFNDDRLPDNEKHINIQKRLIDRLIVKPLHFHNQLCQIGQRKIRVIVHMEHKHPNAHDRANAGQGGHIAFGMLVKVELMQIVANVEAFGDSQTQRNFGVGLRVYIRSGWLLCGFGAVASTTNNDDIGHKNCSTEAENSPITMINDICMCGVFAR